MTELKPCPFCGGEDLDVHVGLYNGRKHESVTITCRNCLGSIYGSTEERAAEAWNTRAATTIGQVAVEVVPTERTCRFIDDSDGAFPPTCSACGYEPSVYECSWLRDGGYEYEGNYCPNCGAKVVDE